jgi:hypothetical protein
MIYIIQSTYEDRADISVIFEGQGKGKAHKARQWEMNETEDN